MFCIKPASLDLAFPHPAGEVGLPVVASLDVQACQVSAAAYVGIDADGVAKVGGNMGFLGGMAADHDLAGHMGSGCAKLLVDQSKGLLLVERNVVLQVGVHEDVGIGFQIRAALAEKLPVAIRDIVETSRTVGLKRFRPPPYPEPVIAVGQIHFREKKLLLVIAREKGDIPFLLMQVDKEIDHTFAIRTPVDVVAHKDDTVVGLGVDDLPELLKRGKAAVYVSDGKCSHVGEKCKHGSY